MRWTILGILLAWMPTVASAQDLKAGFIELAADVSGLTRVVDHRTNLSASSLALVLRPGYFVTDQLEVTGSAAILQDEQVGGTSVNDNTTSARLGADYHFTFQQEHGFHPFVHGSFGYASTKNKAGATATATTFQGGTFAVGAGVKIFVTEATAIRLEITREQFQGGPGREVTLLALGYAFFFGPARVREEQARETAGLLAQRQALESELAATRQAGTKREEALLARSREAEAELVSLRALARDKDALAVRVRGLEMFLAEIAPKPGEVESLTSQLRDLQAELISTKASIAEREAALKARREQDLKEGSGQLLSEIQAEAVFEGDGAEVAAAGRKALDQILEILRGAQGRRIVVEGHTDTLPLKETLRARFPTNWEFSAARAANVAHYLAEHGVDPTRLSAVGYGEHAPVASNDTPEGRARNRRIRILLVPVE